MMITVIIHSPGDDYSYELFSLMMITVVKFTKTLSSIVLIKIRVVAPYRPVRLTAPYTAQLIASHGNSEN